MSAPARAAVERLLGQDAAEVTGVPGGDICATHRVRLDDGTTVFVKALDDAPPGFFAAEARGLRWLRDAHGAPVPRVLGADEHALIEEWVAPGSPTPVAAERFGDVLARTHRAGAERFGVDPPAYIGTLPLPSGGAATWPEFFASQRIEPFARLARDRGALDAAQTATIEQLVQRLPTLAGPPEPPSRIHGDLWTGNLLWGADGAALLIDPAAQGGHRETDLAMLQLFGAPHLELVLAAYDRAWPLSEGWRDRVPLHQVHPLLVHAALFGRSYGAAAVRAAESALRAG
ncbi:fructosamine kinase family protein [Segeticoccus rhizosphaerae]|jgi:fructosamine-3-kinase|uniref:fructosamine kinase family protein n=1 Tax=Segeticoccus rhizosphaerae TaxID=1104777 RepID=UPI0010C08220|nr:fructosamine kinase family protein [Ornithinicoccus soli]